MSAVSPYGSSQYYQTSGQPQTSAPDSLTLLSAVNSGGETAQISAASGSAYLLDLSPEAQSYLNDNISPLDTAGYLSATALASGQNQAFISGRIQQQQINNILQKYNSAPGTQADYEQIQTDLQAAGLSANQLSIQEQV